MEATITIIQKPIEIRFECPHCEEEIIMDIEDFELLVVNEMCDWTRSMFDCPKCENKVEIGYVEWD